MNDTIRIHNLKFSARHGVHPEEKVLFQPFEVDVEVTCDLSRAAETDDLADTIDYSRIAGIVESVITGRSCNLVEKLAGEILGKVCELVPAGNVTVRVRKPRAPLSQTFGSVEVELCRETGT